MHTSISWNLSHSDLAVQNCSTYQQPLLIVIIAFHPSILSYYTIHALHALYHTCTSRIIPYMHFTLTHASYSILSYYTIHALHANPCIIFHGVEFSYLNHRLSVAGLWLSFTISTGCVVPLKKDWAFFCHVGSGNTPPRPGIEPRPQERQTVIHLFSL